MNEPAEKLPRGVVRTPSGKFGIRITNAEGKRPEKVYDTRAEAVKAAKEARNARRRIRVLEPRKPKPIFREIAELGIAYARENHSNPSKMESQLAYFCASTPTHMEGSQLEYPCNTFGDRLAEEISKAEIESFLDSKAANRDWSDGEWAIGTKRGYRTAIRICYKEALRLGLLRIDPTEAIKFKREDQKEVRPITEQELANIRALIAISGNHHRTPAFCRKCLAQLEIASQTGMRKSEQFRATWERIDWARCVLFIPRSKSQQPRDVYLNSYVLAILRALQAEQTRDGVLPTGRIFDIKNPRAWFDRTVARAGIKGITWHSLRHQFATHLVSVGVPIKHVQELMGHLDYESTARYIDSEDKDVFEAIESITDGNIPEYLLNKSYIRALFQDDGDVAAPPVDQPQKRYEALELAPPEEAPVKELQLAPRLLSSIPREELYELVWSIPMTRVARLLGRSDVAVAKACRKRNVPVPPQGYWNKLSAGKPVSPRPTLPMM